MNINLHIILTLSMLFCMGTLLDSTLASNLTTQQNSTITTSLHDQTRSSSSYTSMNRTIASPVKTLSSLPSVEISHPRIATENSLTTAPTVALEVLPSSLAPLKVLGLIIPSVMTIYSKIRISFNESFYEEWETITSQYITEYYQNYRSGDNPPLQVTIKFKSVDQTEDEHNFAIHYNYIFDFNKSSDYHYSNFKLVHKIAKKAFSTDTNKESYNNELSKANYKFNCKKVKCFWSTSTSPSKPPVERTPTSALCEGCFTATSFPTSASLTDEIFTGFMTYSTSPMTEQLFNFSSRIIIKKWEQVTTHFMVNFYRNIDSIHSVVATYENAIMNSSDAVLTITCIFQVAFRKSSAYFDASEIVRQPFVSPAALQATYIESLNKIEGDEEILVQLLSLEFVDDQSRSGKNGTISSVTTLHYSSSIDNFRSKSLTIFVTVIVAVWIALL